MRRNNNPMPMQGRGGGGGPLMTDHLQDLELELELLKRKRQLIQRQQSNMLYNRPGGPLLDDARYNQPSQSYNNRFDEPQHLNFSHLYNDSPRNNQGFGQKRQAQPDWASPLGNNIGNQKRSRPNPFVQPFQNNTQQSFQQQRPVPQPLMNQPKPKPLMNFPVQRNRPVNRAMTKQNQGPKPLSQHPNFKPNNGRQMGGPNRPAGFVPNRAAGFVPNRPAGFVPNKKNASPKKPVQNNPSPPKKSENKIFKADTKPSNKMNGRLELALGMIVKEIRVSSENKPEYKGLFSSMPLSRLMKQGIRERLHSAMLGKVVDKASDIVAEYRQKFPLPTDKEILDLAVFEQKKNNQKLELAITLFEEGDPEIYFKKNMTLLIQTRFDEMMGKLSKMMTDERQAEKDAILANLPGIKKDPNNTAPSETPIADKNESAQEEETATKAETAPEQAPETQTPEETAQPNEEQVKENDAADIYEKERNYDNWLSLYIQRKLPYLVSRHKTNILKIFDLDHMFLNTKAAIILNSNNKALAMKAGQKNNEQGKDDPELPRLPYFAKVLAVPSMPKRKIMQEFLNQFKPKTIKRHKKNYNLLFIGFDDKENYDKILAANQTTLANSTLSIMGNVVKTNTNEAGQIDDIDQVLTPQLDDQINDLLTSIRKADEESNANGDQSVDLTHDDGLEAQEDTNGNENVEETANNETENSANDTHEVTAANGEEKSDNGAVANAAEDTSNDVQVVEGNENSVVTIEDDEVAPLNSDEVKKLATPAKGRAPVTPRSVNTRRSSRLQN